MVFDLKTNHMMTRDLNMPPYGFTLEGARLYKGELASHSRYISVSTTLLTHSFSVSTTVLERWSVNVPACTLRSTAKTHRSRAGSRYRHIGALYTTVATKPFSPDILYYRI